jgi:hypothetical protein
MAVESKRGCGYRKVGGMYLMASGKGVPCCKMPLELSICPCCGEGIKQSRGWTWIDAGKMFKAGDCTAGAVQRTLCPIVNPAMLGRVGLLWIGEKFYKSPREFMLEAAVQGISRRLSAVPREFKPGETWVLFAHPKAIFKPRKVVQPDGRGFDYAIEREDGELEQSDAGGRLLFEAESDAGEMAAQLDISEPRYVPGVFYIAKPEGFEYIVKQSTYDAVLADMASYEASTDPAREKSALLQKFTRDSERGVRWVPVPDEDKDHQGSVHDKEEEPA